jgi:hypothetical protein
MLTTIKSIRFTYGNRIAATNDVTDFGITDFGMSDFKSISSRYYLTNRRADSIYLIFTIGFKIGFLMNLIEDLRYQFYGYAEIGIAEFHHLTIKNLL